MCPLRCLWLLHKHKVRHHLKRTEEAAWKFCSWKFLTLFKILYEHFNSPSSKNGLLTAKTNHVSLYKAWRSFPSQLPSLDHFHQFFLHSLFSVSWYLFFSIEEKNHFPMLDSFFQENPTSGASHALSVVSHLKTPLQQNSSEDKTIAITPPETTSRLS